MLLLLQRKYWKRIRNTFHATNNTDCLLETDFTYMRWWALNNICLKLTINDSTFKHNQQELHRFDIVCWYWRPDTTSCFTKTQTKLSTCIRGGSRGHVWGGGGGGPKFAKVTTHRWGSGGMPHRKMFEFWVSKTAFPKFWGNFWVQYQGLLPHFWQCISAFLINILFQMRLDFHLHFILTWFENTSDNTKH